MIDCAEAESFVYLAGLFIRLVISSGFGSSTAQLRKLLNCQSFISVADLGMTQKDTDIGLSAEFLNFPQAGPDGIGRLFDNPGSRHCCV